MAVPKFSMSKILEHRKVYVDIGLLEKMMALGVSNMVV